MKIKVYDNGGKTFDRYTVILSDGSIIGMSDNPLSPQGFNQYCGDVKDYELENNDAIGQKVSIKSLSDDLKQAIREREEL